MNNSIFIKGRTEKYDMYDSIKIDDDKRIFI